MEKKYDRTIQGEKQGARKQGGQGVGTQGPKRGDGGTEKRGNTEKSPDLKKQQPAQQGGERKQGNVEPVRDEPSEYGPQSDSRDWTR